MLPLTAGPDRRRLANIKSEMAPDLTLQQIADAWGVTVPALLDVLRQSILGEDGSYSVAALAKRWECVPNSVYALIYGGALPAFAINAGDDTRKGWRISKKAVREFEERRGTLGVDPKK